VVVAGAVDVGRADSPETHLAESSAAQQFRQPPAHVNVEAPAGAEVAQGIPEPVPRGMGRLADPRDPVQLLKRDNTPRTDQRRQLGYHPLRVRHIDQQKQGVGKIERCPLQPSTGCRRLHQREIREVKLGGDVPGHGDHASLAVNADRLTGSAHPIAQEIHDLDRAASDVDRPMPYVRDSFWRGREFTSLEQMKAGAVRWNRNWTQMHASGFSGKECLQSG
jgi:hypothetical protein